MQLFGNLLVVDDEEEWTSFLRLRLLKEGHSVVTASSGAEALRHLERDEFDLVISDIRMPGLSGLDVLRQVKDRAPDTEVILATGYAALDTAVECLRSGAADLLQKPIRLGELSISIQRVLERRQLQATDALFRASQAIFSAGDPRQLPSRIVEVSAEAMDADDASLLLAGPDGELSVAQRVASEGAFAPASAVNFARLVAARVGREGSPFLTSDRSDDAWLEQIPELANVRSTLVYPLRAGERLAGVLVLGRHDSVRRFRRPDMVRGSVLASQILLALENARLLTSAVSAERMATLGKLAAVVAHEINTPMSYLLANLEYLRSELGRLPEVHGTPVRELLEAADEALTGANHIRDLARDLRGLSRSVDDRIPVDLGACIQTAVRLAGATLRGRAALDLSLNPEVVVLGSPGHLSQVFVNLLVNAAQSVTIGRTGSKGGRVSLSCRQENGRALVEVADNGPGIAPEHLPLIFEPFFTTKPEGEGTGLGLWISRDIVRRHGGEIRVRSTAGQGATFTVTLPLA